MRVRGPSLVPSCAADMSNEAYYGEAHCMRELKVHVGLAYAQISKRWQKKVIRIENSAGRVAAQSLAFAVLKPSPVSVYNVFFCGVLLPYCRIFGHPVRASRIQALFGRGSRFISCAKLSFRFDHACGRARICDVEKRATVTGMATAIGDFRERR